MRLGLMAVAVVALLAVPAFAQQAQPAPKAAPVASDAGNLVQGFPTQIIDTTTTPEGKLQFDVNAGYVSGEGLQTTLWELSYGVTPDVQISAFWPFIIGEGRVTGNFDTSIEVLGNLYKGDENWPSFGLELIGRFPTGFGFTGYDGTINGVATKAFGAWRANLNAGYTTIGNNETANRAHTDSYKIGVDYMVEDNVCVIADYFNNMAPVIGAERIQMLEVGARWAATQIDTLSLGVGVGVGNGNATPDFTATLGYQRVLN